MKSIYINTEDFDTNVAIAEEGKLCNYFTEKNLYAQNGNVYKGKISKIVANMNFVFVEIGDSKPAFLSEKEYFDFLGEDVTRSVSVSEISEKDKKGKQNDTISGLYKKGQEIMVQVIKEPYNTKGARLTTDITLPGQHIVFAPFMKHTGISKRIQDEHERDRLKKIIRSVKDSFDEDFGIIVRTNAEGVPTEELEKEIRYYYAEWKRIREEYKKFKSPRLLYKEQDIAIKVLREHVDINVAEIIADDPKVHDAVKIYMEETSKKAAQVKLYSGAENIFEYYKIASQTEGIYNNIVSFKKGGYIKIDVTEALTVIDINSGKFKGTDDVENSLLNLNINAAKEVARQIIIRNIGGLIVVDFIDMISSDNRDKVKTVMDEELAKSKVYFKTLQISEYGLMEISRKRDAKRIDDMSFMECPKCLGRGRVLNEESVCLNHLKKIKYECRKLQHRNVLVIMPEHVKKLIEKEYKDKLREYEQKYGKKITIKIGEYKKIDVREEV
ncbi:MAG: Rne/Rng family ribonuclease [bacterium]